MVLLSPWATFASSSGASHSHWKCSIICKSPLPYKDSTTLRETELCQYFSFICFSATMTLFRSIAWADTTGTTSHKMASFFQALKGSFLSAHLSLCEERKYSFLSNRSRVLTALFCVENVEWFTFCLDPHHFWNCILFLGAHWGQKLTF